jgi:hypothetical protein
MDDPHFGCKQKIPLKKTLVNACNCQQQKLKENPKKLGI